MVRALVAAGHVRSAAVEAAFRAVPRHLFLPGVPVERAYADEAVPVDFEGTVATSSASQPSMMAIMLEQLDLRPGQRVLEIGAGTGYNAALLAHLVGPFGHVISVDIDSDLVARAAAHLRAAGVEGVELVTADGAHGYPPRAPYDRIVLTVGASDIRPEWVQQLASGGRLLLPLGLRGTQVCTALDLRDDGTLHGDSVRSCAFIRLRGDAAVSERTVRLAGCTLLIPDDAADIDTDVVAEALTAPGPTRPVPLTLSPVDIFDGFGLWLALHEPTTCRLVAGREDRPPARLLPLGRGRATVALAAAAGEPPGLAALAADSPTASGRWRVRLTTWGPGGAALAERLARAAEAWRAAGRPTADRLRITVVPQGREVPVTDGVTVTKPHARVVVRYG